MKYQIFGILFCALQLNGMQVPDASDTIKKMQLLERERRNGNGSSWLVMLEIQKSCNDEKYSINSNALPVLEVFNFLSADKKSVDRIRCSHIELWSSAGIADGFSLLD